ncbi:MAG TPA: hypothetical protein VFP65_10190 [Anaeromyxobacteraceae bacterium]|nr:hypothetical protein [Anaeromyxobacteraceae bacterium]
MNRTLRSALTLSAGLALALVALPARADHDGDRDHARRDRDCDRAAPVVVAPAPIVVPPRVVVAPAYPAARPAPAYAPVRPVYWNRGAQVRELRAEYRRLDDARANFYATWHGNPVRRDRFEAWYAGRRAELDHRWAELGMTRY